MGQTVQKDGPKTACFVITSPHATISVINPVFRFIPDNDNIASVIIRPGAWIIN